jgi:DNA-binding NtrC family response regulator
VSSDATPRWKARILVIEDDPSQVRLYTKALAQFNLTAVRTGAEAMRIVAEEIPDVILLDHQLAEGERGTDFLPFFKTDLAHVPIIIISGTLDMKSQLRALQGPYSAQYLLEKPVDVQALRETVAHALDECGLAETVRCIRSLERAEMLASKDPERAFAARLARQVELLKRLRDGQPANISRLANDFKVSRRTIARDVQDLVQRGQLSAGALPEDKGS